MRFPILATCLAVCYAFTIDPELYAGGSLDKAEEAVLGRPGVVVTAGTVESLDHESIDQETKLNRVALIGKKHIVHAMELYAQYKRIPGFLRHGALYAPAHYFGEKQGIRLNCPATHPRACLFYVAVRDCKSCEEEIEAFRGTGGLPDVLPEQGFERVKCNSLLTASMDIEGDHPTVLWKGHVTAGEAKDIIFKHHVFHFGVFSVSENDCAQWHNNEAACTEKEYCTHNTDVCSFNEGFCEGDAFYEQPTEKDEPIFPIFPPGSSWRMDDSEDELLR